MTLSLAVATKRCKFLLYFSYSLLPSEIEWGLDIRVNVAHHKRALDLAMLMQFLSQSKKAQLRELSCQLHCLPALRDRSPRQKGIKIGHRPCLTVTGMQFFEQAKNKIKKS
uniref:Uncharacterized protein n=1 Tax=Rhipicephalus zambeziensis TaxID=60191 RepID=A0A224YM20_9ACAR